MYLGKPWTMRQYAGFGAPEETNERFKYLLEQGQTGLSLALDLPTQLGLDADSEEAEGEVGKVGVSITSLKDMETVFQGLPLGEISTSMTINATAGILLSMYEAVALAKNVPAAQISGTVQNDLIKEFGARGAWIFPIQPSVRFCVDIIQDCVQRLPRFNPISIASHYRDAGATPVEEMAYVLSAGVTYVEECVKRGMDIDAFATRLSFFFYTYTNFFEEVAKYRAGRRIWARLMKERFHAKSPAAQMLRAACVCGGHSLTRAEPLNNITRTTLECFAVACAGLQSVFTAAYDEAFAIPTELSARTALRVQQIVAYETEVTKTVDPLGGSYFVEALTDETEQAITQLMNEIDAQGGMIRALESGFIQQAISKRAYEQQRAIESGAFPIVGVNVFRSEEEQAQPQIHRVSAESEERRRREVAVLKRARDGQRVQKSLDRIRWAAARDENVMPAIRDAVQSYATVGEISGALKDVWGVYQPPAKF